MNEKLWNKEYISLIIINIFSAVSFYMVTTLLSKYMIGFGTSISLAGVVVGLFSITSLLIRPVTGYMADSYNRKHLLVVASALVSISVFGYMLTTSIPVIIFFRILNGIGFGISSTALVATASEYIPHKDLGSGIGYLGLGQIIAAAVAPGFGIMLMNIVGIRATFLCAGIIAALGFLLMSCFKYKKRTMIRKKFQFRINDFFCTNVLHYTVIGSLYSFINGIIASFLVLYAEKLGIADISIYFAVCSIFLFLGRPLSGYIMDKKGLKYVVYPALICTGISLVMLSVSTTLMMILATAVLRSIGQGLAQPSLQAASIKKVGIDKSGVATSTYYLGGDIGQGIGPMIGGVVVAHSGYKALFLYCAILMFVGVVVFFITTKKDK